MQPFRKMFQSLLQQLFPRPVLIGATNAPEIKAYQEGYEAYLRGGHNPHDNTAPEYLHWEKGFWTAQADHAW